MQHADVADAFGHLDAEQPLDRQAERHAVGLRAQVIHPLDERDHLLPLLLFGGFLDARVQVADRRRRREHGLAIELEHQPQHAVRAGVLRPHVDGHHFGLDLGHLRHRARSLTAFNKKTVTEVSQRTQSDCPNKLVVFVALYDRLRGFVIKAIHENAFSTRSQITCSSFR